MKVMIPDLPEAWKTHLQAELQKDYWQPLTLEVNASYLIDEPPVYPPAPLVFRALELCSSDQVKVVILGQDPYHGVDQAMGLSFSVPNGFKIPPSLQNIYKEIADDLNQSIPKSGNLEHWAKQGVLLLNATLTVEASNAGSHQGKGWEQFTDQIIKTVSNEKENVVFLLWGKFAQAKSNLIDESKHLILTAPHPSPLSAHRGFFGCNHFSQTNNYLKAQNLTEITW
ncbi:MAG: uracil-DNA glycosylase [Candidatus Paceibacteria bacterium]|jgi:uracil-DNA glycosylase